MANTNEQIAERILMAVGGKANITSLTHCMTRLRFTLKDMNLPDQEAVKGIKGVMGAVVSGGQFQVIVGQNVPNVYAALCERTGLQEAVPMGDELERPREKLTLKGAGGSVMAYLSGSMTPLIPVMIAAAMFKTVMVLLGPDMLGLFTAESDLYIQLDFLYDAFYYFLPVFIGATAAKKLGIDPYLGIFAGAILVVPDFAALSGARESLTIYGFLPAPVNSYGQTVLPILLTAAVMRPIYRLFKRIIPDTLSTIFVTFLTAAVIVPLELCALAPLGSILGNYLGSFLIAFGDFGGFIAVALVAGLWEFLVMTGMHQVLIVFAITTMMSVGYDNFVLLAGNCATWAAFGMALGGALRLREKEEKALSFGFFISGILGGVTEPALYGLGLKYKRPFIPLFLGGAVGGLYAGLTGARVYVMGATNFLSLTGFVAGGTANTINGIAACLLAMTAAAVFTFFFGFSKKDLQGSAS